MPNTQYFDMDEGVLVYADWQPTANRIIAMDLQDGSTSVLCSIPVSSTGLGHLALDGMRLSWIQRNWPAEGYDIKTAMIPEPAALAFLSLGGFTVLARRRRLRRRP